MTEKDRILCSVDVGSCKIVTLIASVGERDKVNLIGASSVPSKGIKKGQIVDIESAAQAITESLEGAERMAGIQISSAYLSIGGSHIESLNTHAVVAVSPQGADINQKDLDRLNEIARAVALPSSREILHALPIKYTIDGQEGIKNPLGMSGTRLEIDTHVITGSRVAISNLMKCVEKVGINIEELIFSGIASSEAVLTDTEKDLGVVLIDVGSETTDVVVYVEGSIVYTTVIPVGARYITNDIAVGLKVSLESAEIIKHKLTDLAKKPKMVDGIMDDKKEDILDLKTLGITEETDKISIKTTRDTIIRSRVREIFELVGKELKKSGYASVVPFGVVVCGGGALTVGILEQIKYALGFQARVGKAERFTGLAEEIDSPVYAVASGLILSASKTQLNETTINFQVLGKSFSIKNLFYKFISMVKSFLP